MINNIMYQVLKFTIIHLLNVYPMFDTRLMTNAAEKLLCVVILTFCLTFCSINDFSYIHRNINCIDLTKKITLQRYF